MTLPRPKLSAHTKPTRERLLEAAEERLQRSGYSGLSLQEVAKASGIRKPGLYHHFPGGKDELVFVVAERVLQRNEVELRQAIASASGAEAQLRAIASWLLSESCQLDQVLRETVRFMPEENRDKVAKAASSGRRSGLCKPLSMKVSAKACFARLTPSLPPMLSSVCSRSSRTSPMKFLPTTFWNRSWTYLRLACVLDLYSVL